MVTETMKKRANKIAPVMGFTYSDEHFESLEALKAETEKQLALFHEDGHARYDLRKVNARQYWRQIYTLKRLIKRIDNEIAKANAPVTPAEAPAETPAQEVVENN